MPLTRTSSTPRLALAALLALLALSACSYSYRNPVESLGPGEVGGRTVAGAALVIDGVAVSLKGAALDGASRGNGRFTMLPLPVGRHTLVFRKGKGRSVQRDVEIAWGQDGQPGGLWLGDVEVPATSSVTGSISAPAGVTLADNGVAVDEVSGAVVPVDAGGGFRFDELAIGPHRIRVAMSDASGARYLAGPTTVEVLATDAGTEKVLTALALRRAAPTAPPARVTIRVGVVGDVPGLKPIDLVLTGLDQSVPLQSNGMAQVDLAEGLWTVGLKLPTGFDTVTPPTPVTFVAGQGEVIDLGGLYAVADAAASLARLACHADADCAPGSCTASHVCDANYRPQQQAPASLPFCGPVASGCTPGLPIGTSLPHAALCAATAVPNLNVGVPCGGCCTSDGLDTLCGRPGVGGCPSTAPAAPICNAGGWCWEHPLPQGSALHGLSGTSPIDAWAVGDAGTILHWSGSAWSNSPSGTTSQLNAAWSVSGTEAWAVGEAGTILRWNGSGWTGVSSGTPSGLHGIWGSSATDAWAVGDSGTVLHWNGSGWAPAASNTTGLLYGVWGSGPNDVWAVGYDPVALAAGIIHWDGTSWGALPFVSANTLTSVWGSSATDVWAVGAGGAIFHWDGASWSASPSGTTLDLMSAWGTGSADVWAVGETVLGETATILHWNGAAWSSVPSGVGVRLQGAWSTASNDAWAVGVGGATLHWNGTDWSGLSGATIEELNSVWGSSPSDVWAVGWSVVGAAIRAVTAHWDGKGWRFQTSATAALWDGTTWRFDSATSAGIYEVWGFSASDAWAVTVGAGTLHWDGVAWTDVPSSVSRADDLLSVWGASASDVWAVGGDGTSGVIAHWNGSAWSSAPSGTVDLYSVWGSAANDVWAVGYGGTIIHWDGSAWTPFTSGTANYLIRVRGRASNDLWVVGDLGTILHWDGSTWSNVPSGVTVQLENILPISSSDAWAVGDQGLLLHWDGLAWTAVPSGTGNLLSGLWRSPAGDLLTVGVGDTILRHRP
jgi:hypothetical protein